MLRSLVFIAIVSAASAGTHKGSSQRNPYIAIQRSNLKRPTLNQQSQSEIIKQQEVYSSSKSDQTNTVAENKNWVPLLPVRHIQRLHTIPKQRYDTLIGRETTKTAIPPPNKSLESGEVKDISSSYRTSLLRKSTPKRKHNIASFVNPQNKIENSKRHIKYAAKRPHIINVYRPITKDVKSFEDFFKLSKNSAFDNSAATGNSFNSFGFGSYQSRGRPWIGTDFPLVDDTRKSLEILRKDSKRRKQVSDSREGNLGERRNRTSFGSPKAKSTYEFYEHEKDSDETQEKPSGGRNFQVKIEPSPVKTYNIKDIPINIQDSIEETSSYISYSGFDKKSMKAESRETPILFSRPISIEKANVESEEDAIYPVNFKQPSRSSGLRLKKDTFDSGEDVVPFTDFLFDSDTVGFDESGKPFDLHKRFQTLAGSGIFNQNEFTSGESFFMGGSSSPRTYHDSNHAFNFESEIPSSTENVKVSGNSQKPFDDYVSILRNKNTNKRSSKAIRTRRLNAGFSFSSSDENASDKIDLLLKDEPSFNHGNIPNTNGHYRKRVQPITSSISTDARNANKVGSVTLGTEISVRDDQNPKIVRARGAKSKPSRRDNEQRYQISERLTKRSRDKSSVLGYVPISNSTSVKNKNSEERKFGSFSIISQSDDEFGWKGSSIHNSKRRTRNKEEKKKKVTTTRNSNSEYAHNPSNERIEFFDQEKSFIKPLLFSQVNSYSGFIDSEEYARRYSGASSESSSPKSKLTALRQRRKNDKQVSAESSKLHKKFGSFEVTKVRRKSPRPNDRSKEQSHKRVRSERRSDTSLNSSGYYIMNNPRSIEEAIGTSVIKRVAPKVKKEIQEDPNPDLLQIEETKKKILENEWNIVKVIQKIAESV